MYLNTIFFWVIQLELIEYNICRSQKLFHRCTCLFFFSLFFKHFFLWTVLNGHRVCYVRFVYVCGAKVVTRKDVEVLYCCNCSFWHWRFVVFSLLGRSTLNLRFSFFLAGTIHPSPLLYHRLIQIEKESLHRFSSPPLNPNQPLVCFSGFHILLSISRDYHDYISHDTHSSHYSLGLEGLEKQQQQLKYQHHVWIRKQLFFLNYYSLLFLVMRSNVMCLFANQRCSYTCSFFMLRSLISYMLIRVNEWLWKKKKNFLWMAAGREWADVDENQPFLLRNTKKTKIYEKKRNTRHYFSRCLDRLVSAEKSRIRSAFPFC